MKKTAKKFLTSVLALAVACTMVTPITAEAKVEAPKQITLYRESNVADLTTYESIRVSGISSSTKVTSKNLKSSNKSVVEPRYIEKSSSTYKYEYHYPEGEPSTSTSKYYYVYVGLSIKKAGTATVSYKIGNTIYKTKVTAKKYTNPIKTFNIAGIKSGSSTNLASKLNKQNSANLKLTSTKKDAKLTVEAKSGWKITDVELYNYSTSASYEARNYNGVSKIKDMGLGTLKAKESAYVRIVVQNTSNNAELYCYYYIN